MVEIQFYVKSPAVSMWLASGVRGHLLEMPADGRVMLAVGVYDPSLGCESAARLAGEMLRPAADGKGRAGKVGQGGYEVSAGEDGVLVIIETDRASLSAELGRIAAVLTRPAAHESALASWRAAIEEEADKAGWPGERLVLMLLGCEDAQRGDGGAIAGEPPIEPACRLLSGGAVESAVVGDISAEDAAHMLARHLGGLADRPRVVPYRQTAEAAKPVGHASAAESADGRAVAVMVSPGPDIDEVGRLRELRLVGAVLESRSGGRFKVALLPAMATPGSGAVAVIAASSSDGDGPKAPAELLAQLRQAVAELAREGPTADELSEHADEWAQRSRRVLASPWMMARLLGQLDRRGLSLDTISGADHAYSSISAEAVRKAAAGLLGE